MKLNDLQHNQVVTYRLGLHGEDRINWQDWQQGSLYISKRQFPFKNHPVGEILTLTPQNQEWAEYSWRDYSGNGFFSAEEFCMEVKDLD